MGRLGSIAFKRAWTYWVTEGLVPMAVAEELYADPVGVTDIRVAGHAAAPAPEEWAEWIMPDGHQVWPASEEAASLDFRNRHPEWKIPEDLFSDNPAELGATRGITTYHIDTEVGLRVFADTLRAHSLTSNSVTQ